MDGTQKRSQNKVAKKSAQYRSKSNMREMNARSRKRTLNAVAQRGLYVNSHVSLPKISEGNRGMASAVSLDKSHSRNQSDMQS